MTYKDPNYQKNYREANKEACNTRSRTSQAKRRRDRPEEVLRIQKAYLYKARLDVFTHYSNGAPKCACCGEDHMEFLSLDHINGGGNKLQESGSEPRGANKYAWLRKNGYPKGFRVLCHNCNMSLGLYGYCPHYNGLKGGLKCLKT